jgi:fatty-acyl-CoA synthase
MPEDFHIMPELAEVAQSPAKVWLRALEVTAPISNHPNRIFSTVIEELADKCGQSTALLSDNESLTFRELAERSNQYTRWALNQEIARGQTVCLLMPNRPEYLAVWIGITSVGGVVALLNTNLAGASLAHCINGVDPKHIIVAAQLGDAFLSAQPYIAANVKIWVHGSGAVKVPRIDLELNRYSGQKLGEAERRPVTIKDLALYIYTSGTTGLPKAAKISHYRLMQWSHWFAGMMDTKSNDRMYNCLPMYHSVGGVVAVGAVLVNGGSVVLREKFSVKHFWDDVISSGCTLFQYIGELCRYLLRAPTQPHERDHQIRLCCGLGLRLDVWNDFKNRFRIPQILEFYAATEGNVALYNVDGEPGAIGRIPAFLGHRHAVALLKFDIEKGEPVRTGEGFCIQCAVNEIGEAVGKISSATSDVGSNFEGYTTKDATEKKIIRDVFKKGDAWFRTGDLMQKDKRGYFYFVDRVGETFRWKGENVSTTEVSAIIMTFPHVLEASVYGVPIPGTDGRAGMAAIVVDESFDLTELATFLESRLPRYAHPVFVRICSKIETTETLRQKKYDLMRQGYDPTITSDSIYFKEPERESFVRLGPELHDSIMRGCKI